MKSRPFLAIVLGLATLILAVPTNAASVPDWSGYYVGGQLGSVRASDAQTLQSPLGVTATNIDLSGDVAGLHVGKNFQTGHLVWGPILDISRVAGMVYIAGLFLGFAYVATASLVVPTILHTLFVVVSRVFVKD
jgi:hypothetical protein